VIILGITSCILTLTYAIYTVAVVPLILLA